MTRSRRAAIYVVTAEPGADLLAPLALEALQRQVDEVIVVSAQGHGVLAALPSSVRIVAAGARPPSYLRGLSLGLAALRPQIDRYCSVIVTGSDAIGPMQAIPAATLDPAAAGAALVSPYWFDPKLVRDWDFGTGTGRIPALDLAAFGPDLLDDAEFWIWLDGLKSVPPGARTAWHKVRQLQSRIEALGKRVVYPVPEGLFETAEPGLYEPHKVVAAGGPVLPVALFRLDPLLHDLNAIYLRQALETLREAAPEAHRTLTRFALRQLPLRDFATIAEEYEIIPETARAPGRNHWPFGPVAVFIHAYHAEMMPQFVDLLARLPCAFDLFITTASEANRAGIEATLAAAGLPDHHREVRVVAQNRGRDMSSLFITFRDIVLSDRYALALRLHSKRTPQVSRQVGESFKDHLFENLVATPDHVRNILDLFEDRPDVGLVIPPVIHGGFSTLGHAWYTNRPELERLLVEMGITLPLDEHTPVAAYGTMYWFRPAALRQLFERRWAWEDYNAEPNHTDGGLAHVQERLIAYVAQANGFRTVSVMTPRHAARGYARLEYKLATLAAHLSSGNIVLQRDELRSRSSKLRRGLYRELEMRYARFLNTHPELHRFVSPLARRIGALLRK